MFGWFKLKSSLKAEQVRWLDERFHWLRNQFGEERLRGAVITPTNEFFPEAYAGTHEDAAKIFDRVCAYMGIDHSRVNLKLFSDPYADAVVASYNPAQGGKYALGLYQERDGIIDIWLETTRLDDPSTVVATLAHELGHVHLLADQRCENSLEDHEPLTDLLVVYFGMGIFAANSSIRDVHWRAGHISASGVSRQGYLSIAEYGYALALFASARGEHEPAWANYLRKDARSSFKMELTGLIERGGANAVHVAKEAPLESASCEQTTEAGSAENLDEDSEGNVAADQSGLSTADDFFEQGVRCNASGQYELATDAFTRALELKPNDEEALSERAWAYIGLAKYAQAIADCTKSLEFEPACLETICRRAVAHVRLRQFKEALADADRAIREEPKSAYAWLLRGVAQIGLGQAKEAVRDLSKAVRYAPRWGDNYLARSRAYKMLGDSKRSQADLFESIQRKPEYAHESVRSRSLVGSV
jgi:tetratricopeptide (TPR) repeat protein